jgi:hypothetical protein
MHASDEGNVDREARAGIAREHEPRLRRAIDAASGRGWARPDVRHALGKLRQSLQLAAYDSLDGCGLEVWARGCRLRVSELRQLLTGLEALIRWLPPLCEVTAERVDDRDGQAALLERVRALLAKAESTTFEAEADALAAKAQELMARHAIDRAVVEGRGARRDGDVGARRFHIEDPYARARFTLLSEVARACSCEALLMEKVGIAHVFGFADDLAAVDLLYTSLLVQAGTAMASARPPGHRSASQVAAFRRAFLVAFARRVGERLAAARAAAVIDAQRVHGDDVLPVLAGRRARVDAYMADVAPASRRMTQRLSDGGGYDAGLAAGSRATFATQARVPTGPVAIGRARPAG